MQLDLKNNELKIGCDCGRCTRPVYIVDYKKQTSMINGNHVEKIKTGEWEWKDLMKNGPLRFPTHRC